jgi:hypothetical protein
MKGQGTSFDPILNVNGKQQQFSGQTTDVLNVTDSIEDKPALRNAESH